MTVKELKEKLEQFPEDCIVLVPNMRVYRDTNPSWYVQALDVWQGVNEMDGFVIIDDETDE